MPTAATVPPPTPDAALVTGASAGLGAEFARQLARGGTPLILVARDAGRLEGMAAILRADHGVTVEVLPADLATDAGIERIAQRLGASPAVGLLVNNAGFGTRGKLAAADAAGQEAMVRLHVLAVSRLTQAALPGMLARGRGAIVTVSSIAAYLTSPGNANYCATKAYQRVLMEALSKEVAGRGVHVQALCPGFTRTEFHQRAALAMEHVPAALWLDAPRVVAESLAAVRRGGPTVVVPGWHFRALITLLRHLPPRLLARGERGYRRATGQLR